MPEMRLDHISFLVADLDAAIEKWRGMLRVLDPEQAERISYGEAVSYTHLTLPTTERV